ncbi:methylated-DNA--[protein]-cysteine S-methyltransferase [Pantanalinema rosaneae CENA516]|uniref:methylated-DNA--[protein]-cysteine S-methyltransferase n=1 Tax=Pantanalinema rosaneae TaxID=1620701 RepID=UPI003D6EB40F
MVQLLTATLNSPLGKILLVSHETHLCALDFADYETRMLTLLQKRYGSFRLSATTYLQDISDRITAYLAGDYHALDAVPVSTGGTPFQQRVWATLRTIPPGTVISYRDLAERIGQPNACRAVGMANSQNPIAIVLPCHRVISSNNQLTGYAGGLPRKYWLLQHEGLDVSLFQ